jgi:glycosyltransferase involved in cell wall biosynthesis
VATITTDWPGCRDAVEPGVTGVLVPPRDARALAEALESLADDRGRCVAMGGKARERALEQFDIRTVTERHLETYQRLLAGAAP